MASSFLFRVTFQTTAQRYGAQRATASLDGRNRGPKKLNPLSERASTPEICTGVPLSLCLKSTPDWRTCVPWEKMRLTGDSESWVLVRGEKLPSIAWFRPSKSFRRRLL